MRFDFLKYSTCTLLNLSIRPRTTFPNLANFYSTHCWVPSAIGLFSRLPTSLFLKHFLFLFFFHPIHNTFPFSATSFFGLFCSFFPSTFLHDSFILTCLTRLPPDLPSPLSSSSFHLDIDTSSRRSQIRLPQLFCHLTTTPRHKKKRASD